MKLEMMSPRFLRLTVEFHSISIALMTTCQEMAGFTENPWLDIAMSQAETRFTAIQ